MCNILILPPYSMINREEFENMCYNNWHSWGLVTKIDGKLDIQKVVPQSGEIDADEIEKIWKLLDRDQEFERILHVRHNTAGATTLENAHPFDVYYDPKSGRQVVFMHNGTMYEYKSKKVTQNSYGVYTTDDDLDGPSDSKNFVDKILTPMLASADYGNGHGDICNKMFHLIMSKMFPSGNRGLLIASDQPDLLLGDWKTIKDSNGKEIKTANTDYFKDVTRGPENDRRKEREKLAREAERRSASPAKTNTNKTGQTVVPLKDFVFNKHSIYRLNDSMANLTDDWSVWDRSHAMYLGGATRDELEELYSNKNVCLIVMDWIFADYYSVNKELNDLDDKHQRQASYINSLHSKLKTAGIDLENLEVEKLVDMVTANTKAA